MILGQALLALLIFPGLLYAVLMGWLMVWIERKLTARMQGRIGPPFYQPFFDFIKLLAKRSLPRPGFEGLLMTGLPLLASGAMLGALTLLPILPGRQGFAGDMILLVSLLEIPPLCAVLAGFASRSIFGQVGATREAVLSITYNLPFLTAVVALAVVAGSLNLNEIASWSVGQGSSWLANVGRLLAVLAITLCLPVKLRLNPFSLSNAEQEIYTGPTTEFGGPRLALWELAHGMEWVALTGFVISVGISAHLGSWLADVALFAVLSLVLVIALTTLAAGTARIKIYQATRLYWRWGLSLALVALIIAVWPV